MIWPNKLFKQKKYIIEYTDSPKFITNILKKLNQRHSTITVNFAGYKKQFVTMVIEVDQDKNQFILDELVPREGHNKAMNGEQLRLAASDNGIAIILKATVIDTVMKDDNQYYVLNIPENIEYKQRRKAFRVPINIENNVPLQINKQDYSFNNIKMQNISFTGLSFIAKQQNLEEQIKISDILEPLVITTSEHKNIYLKLQIKRVHYNDRENNTLIAGKFIDLTHNQQRSIELFVSELERENIRSKEDKENLE